MTREEAIKWLIRPIVSSTEIGEFKAKELKAYELAIEALAERPTVDKEYLIDLIQESVYDGEACAKLIDLVDRPTGKWVVKDGETVCSLCGNSVSFSWTEDGWVLGKFCQTCGARMKGGVE